MKKMFISFAMVLVLLQSFAQTPSQPGMTKSDYLQKSKHQKKVGWLLLGGGVVSTLLGVGVVIGSSLDATNKENAAADILGVAGFSAILGSIPFFISAGKNKRKAASLSINTQKIMYLQQKDLSMKVQPAVTFRIRF